MAKLDGATNSARHRISGIDKFGGPSPGTIEESLRSSAEKGVAGLVDIDWEYGDRMGIAEIGMGGRSAKQLTPNRSTTASWYGPENRTVR